MSTIYQANSQHTLILQRGCKPAQALSFLSFCRYTKTNTGFRPAAFSNPTSTKATPLLSVFLCCLFGAQFPGQKRRFAEFYLPGLLADSRRSLVEAYYCKYVAKAGWLCGHGHEVF